MDSYYILSLNNNIYAVSRNGVKLDYSLSTVFDDNDTDSNFYINSYGGCMIIGKEIEGKMYDFFTDEEIRYIKVGSDKDVPYLSYYEKRKIPKSLVVLMLERYRKINILSCYAHCHSGMHTSGSPEIWCVWQSIFFHHKT